MASANSTPRSNQYPLIGFDKAPSVRRLDKLGLTLTRDLFAFRCDSDVGQYAALRAGFGLGFCQVALAKRDRLVPVLSGQLSLALGMWLVMHQDLKTSRRMRLMFDYLVTYLEGYIASEA